MISAKAAQKLSWLLVCFVGSLVLAEGKPFKIASPIPPDFEGTPSEFASQLKHEAVTKEIKSRLKERFSEFEEKITPEFTEKFIMDFRPYIGRTAVKVEGHINEKALKQWADGALGASEKLNPLFVFSSHYPGNQIAPRQTSSAVRGTNFGKALTAVLIPLLKPLNVRLILGETNRITRTQPAQSESEIRNLRNVALSSDSKTALWLHLVQCYSCGGARLDAYFYNFEQSRIAFTDSMDLKMGQSEFSDVNALTKLLTPPLTAFQKKLKPLIFEGSLFASVFRLVVQGISIDSHTQFENQVNGLTYVNSLQLRSVQPEGAEFEIMTQLPLTQFRNSLAKERFQGFSLKVLGVDSGGVVVRYWKPKTG